MLHGISAIFPPQKEHEGRKGSDSLRKTLHRQGLFVTQVKLTLSCRSPLAPNSAIWAWPGWEGELVSFVWLQTMLE